jgi:hypothetical protein
MPSNVIEGPAEIYGRLLEGAYNAGPSFERVCIHLEYILQQVRLYEADATPPPVDDSIHLALARHGGNGAPARADR